MFTGSTVMLEVHCPKEDREAIVHKVATIIAFFIVQYLSVCFVTLSCLLISLYGEKSIPSKFRIVKIR